MKTAFPLSLALTLRHYASASCPSGTSPSSSPGCLGLCKHYYTEISNEWMDASSGCLDPAVGENQILSCAQACDAVVGGASEETCTEACAVRGCDITVGGAVYTTCGECVDGGSVTVDEGCRYACQKASKDSFNPVSTFCGECAKDEASPDGTSCDECDEPAWYGARGGTEFGKTSCPNCNSIIRPLNGCCTFTWIDIIIILFQIPFTLVPLSVWMALILSAYTSIRFNLQGEECSGSLESKRSWSETTGSGKNRRTVTYYEVTMKYPSEGPTMATSPQIIQKKFLTDSNRYDNLAFGDEVGILRMPLPIDPRRAYLTADIGSSLGCKDEDCNFKTPWNFIKIVLYTLFSVFCMTLATGIQVFVGVMFTFAMYAVNFLIPYCTTNLLTWPLIGFIIFGWVYTQLWEWVEQDLEGSFVENNPVLARAGKLVESKSTRSFKKVKVGTTGKLLGGGGRGSRTSSVVGVMNESLRDLAKQSPLSSLGSWASSVNGKSGFVDVEQGVELGHIGVSIGGERSDHRRAGDIKGWGSVTEGHICCGPGMLYLHDDNVTVVDEDCMDEEAARKKVEVLNKSEPDNPIVMWQIGNPWSDGAYKGSKLWDKQYFIGMKKSYMTQPGVVEREPRVYAEKIKSYQPERVWGSPFYYAKFN